MHLTGETIESVLDLIAQGKRVLDLQSTTSIDVYALLLLDLAVCDGHESGRPLRVTWPETPRTRNWMTEMGFFADIKAGGGMPRRAQPTVLSPIAKVERDADVTRLVGAFDDRLSDRFPIDESPRRRFLAILLELFQNIPQHANATGDVLDPHGLAALHDDGASVHLAVVDKGIGFARSLGLRGSALSDADALRAVAFDGRSRFRDPGRGHKLERVLRRVRSWEGTILVRSGTALLYQSDLGGDIVDVAPFPGVQIAVSIPRAAFGIGEVPLSEVRVESPSDPGFNGQDEEDDSEDLAIRPPARNPSRGRSGAPCPHRGA